MDVVVLEDVSLVVARSSSAFESSSRKLLSRLRTSKSDLTSTLHVRITHNQQTLTHGAMCVPAGQYA